MPLPRRRLLQVIAVGGALILEGCGAPQQVTPTPTPTPTADDLLAMASRRLAETTTVHFTLAVEGDTFIDPISDMRLLSAQGDLRRPDSVRTTFQVEVMGRAVTLQLISIGGESWMTNLLTGEWEEAPVEFAYRPEILFSAEDGIGPVMSQVTNARRLEDEEISGRPVYHVQGAVDQELVRPLTYNTVKGSPVAVELWIDRETHDLLRARLAEPPGTARPHPAVWTLDLSHHDEEVSIEPPV